jgi:hypothetical protein
MVEAGPLNNEGPPRRKPRMRVRAVITRDGKTIRVGDVTPKDYGIGKVVRLVYMEDPVEARDETWWLDEKGERVAKRGMRVSHRTVDVRRLWRVACETGAYDVPECDVKHVVWQRQEEQVLVKGTEADMRNLSPLPNSKR